MTFDDWREPSRLLRRRLRAATEEQLALAAHLEMRLPKRTPALLAAALLRERMADALRERIREPSYQQLEYLRDLAPWARGNEKSPETASMASAMIDMLETRRALDALVRRRPSRGDVVIERRLMHSRAGTGKNPDHFRIVASVGHDGVVHFMGGGGHRARAHRVELLYRADDQTPTATAARDAAGKAAFARRQAGDYSTALNSVKVQRLLPWLVQKADILARDVDALRGVVETAEDEAPIQMFLGERPHLLAILLRGAQGRWVVPQLRLGDKYVADFFIADADSSGIRWQLVELESPRVRPLTRMGEWRKEARHAQHQIRTWRHYLAENLDSARKPRQDEGLGLVDIESGVPGLILISRRSLIADDPVWMRRALKIDSGVEMHTYDWLIEQVETASRSSTGGIW